MDLYLPILILGVIAAAFAVGSVGIALLIGPRRYNRAKLEAYECGIEPAPHPFGHLGTFALAEMGLFMATVFVAYAYVWRRGGLDWD